MGRSAGKLSYANVVSTLALLLALTGATAFAAGKVGSREIKVGAVKSKHIARNAVKPRKVAPNAIRQRHIKPNAVGYRQIGPDSIDGTKVINGSLTAADIAGGGGAAAAGGASVVTTAAGGPVEIVSDDPQDPDPIPLAGAGWTQGAAQTNLFAARAQFTLESEPASTCIVEIRVESDGEELGAVFAAVSGSDPSTEVEEVLLEGARVGAGVQRPLELSAAAFVVPAPGNVCVTARVDSLQIAVLGIG